jgi:hypothetical protein
MKGFKKLFPAQLYILSSISVISQSFYLLRNVGRTEWRCGFWHAQIVPVVQTNCARQSATQWLAAPTPSDCFSSRTHIRSVGLGTGPYIITPMKSRILLILNDEMCIIRNNVTHVFKRRAEGHSARRFALDLPQLCEPSPSSDTIAIGIYSD